ncbi:hypothetical protein NG798_23820 [Ancylothrix sp. C2]|uniref:hypothetical protein n=1 Tax=Ancylothrix sp. D3o TaxID=2953691 RepID=UPI0021BA6C31|nr:hypothetical protein [Ancylothrix sp. D3o]MCT7952833.1 hypothetical protein [Ancylothrix sp. D3o]
MPRRKQTTETAPTLFNTTAYQTRQFSSYDWEDCEPGDEPVVYVAPVKKPEPVEENPRAEKAEKCRQEFINYLKHQKLPIKEIYNITLTKNGVPVISYLTLTGKKASTFLPKKILSDAIFGMCNALTFVTTNDLSEPIVSNIREVSGDKTKGFCWTAGDAKEYKDAIYGSFTDLCTKSNLIDFFNSCWLNLDAVLYLRQSLIPPAPKPPAPAPAPKPAATSKRSKHYEQLTLFAM